MNSSPESSIAQLSCDSSGYRRLAERALRSLEERAVELCARGLGEVKIAREIVDDSAALDQGPISTVIESR